MNNKVFVTVYIPSIEEKYNLFLPINKRIGNIIILINKAVRDLYPAENNFLNDRSSLYNQNSGEMYNMNALLHQTNIRNGSKLVLL